MDPPSILLDRSFLEAVADSGNPNYDAAKAMYRSLIDDFVAQRCLLVARADHLAAVPNPELFAAIDKLHIARQHRNAADTTASRTGVDPDVAITLVLIQRNKVRKVASFDPRLSRYEIELVAPNS